MQYPGLLYFRLRCKPTAPALPCLDVMHNWELPRQGYFTSPAPQSAVLLQLSDGRLEWFRLDRLILDEESTRANFLKMQGGLIAPVGLTQ